MERGEQSHYSAGPSANNQKHRQMEPCLRWRLRHRAGPERAKMCTVIQKAKENKQTRRHKWLQYKHWLTPSGKWRAHSQRCNSGGEQRDLKSHCATDEGFNEKILIYNAYLDVHSVQTLCVPPSTSTGTSQSIWLTELRPKPTFYRLPFESKLRNH